MPATLTPMTVTSTSVLERVGTALSDPTRVRVLVALRDAPAYPSELAEALGVSRQSLSNHLSCLRGCGLVVSVPEGRRSRYELVDPKLGHALTDLLGIVLAVDPEHQDHGHRMTPAGARGPGDGPGPPA